MFITDRGHPAHVLLTIDAYQKITEKPESIIDLLAMPETDDIDFEPTKLNKIFIDQRILINVLLDTNVISELRKAKSNKADKHVVKWANSVSATSLFISVITILEIKRVYCLLSGKMRTKAQYFEPGLIHTFSCFL